MLSGGPHIHFVHSASLTSSTGQEPPLAEGSLWVSGGD